VEWKTDINRFPDLGIREIWDIQPLDTYRYLYWSRSLSYLGTS
jgi:hypothetical protein